MDRVSSPSLSRLPGRLRLAVRHRPLAALPFLAALLLLALVLAASIGSVAISPLDIVRMTLNKLAVGHFTPTWPPQAETIIFDIRLPRVLGAALVGAGLATAGALFQGLLRNPLADPYFIGTSAGAALGATVAMLLPIGSAFMGFGTIPMSAFLGALLTVFAVYSLARSGGKAPVVTLLLSGFVVSSFLIAIMTLLITVDDRLQLNLRQLLAFLLGGLGASSWQQLMVVAPMILGGLLLSRLLAGSLNAFAVGEEGAAYLGVEVERDKFLILALGALLTGAAVSISGIVGFVGLMMPHAVRLLLGPDHRLLLPAAALAGAAFLAMADLVARTVLAPTEIPVGIITAMLGGPFLLYLLRRSLREYAF